MRHGIGRAEFNPAGSDDELLGSSGFQSLVGYEVEVVFQERVEQKPIGMRIMFGVGDAWWIDPAGDVETMSQLVLPEAAEGVAVFEFK